MAKPERRRSRKVTRKHAHTCRQTGGVPVFAGAQGCVFKPALKCKDVRRDNNDGNISKLEERASAEAEMREYTQIKQHLGKIKNYWKYFSLQAHMCEPDPLEPRDLVNFDNVCLNFERFNITAANVNSNLGKLRMINMPDLGIDLKQWMDQTPLTPDRVRQLNDHVSTLLMHAVGPMNRLGVIHNDLKSENVMIDRNNNVRIIDWGLAGITTPQQVIPAHHFMNNPVTFNRPFSTLVISPQTCELYETIVLKSATLADPSVEQLKHFTRAVHKEYIDMYIGEHKYLQYIFKSMFGYSDEVLIDAVATYTAEILHHFTDRVTRTFRLNEYFSNVYRYNTDVWGLMSVFYSICMMPRQNVVMADAVHADMLHRYRTLFRTVVFANGHERMNVAHIVQQLRQITDAVTTHAHHKKSVRFNVKFRPHNTNTIKRVPTPYPRHAPKRSRFK
jgi:serine/threonine protein kinase